MGRPILADAFAHHVWATITLLEACAALEPEELETAVPGTYGSIVETMRHLVEADSSYLALLSDGRVPRIDASDAVLPALHAAMEAHGPVWAWLVTRDLDPDRILVRLRDDGSESHAPLGVRLAQALHHGTDHRSQVCTALTTLGVTPPDIDAWAFARQDGRLVDIPAPPPGT